jgi:hypothetical protein
MKGINLSIASSLKSKRDAALKGLVNPSSTSSNESNKSLSDDDEVQHIGTTYQEEENLSNDGSELPVKPKKKGGKVYDGKARKGSRVKKTSTRFTIDDWKPASNNKRGPAISEEWQSAINEWESLSMRTYQREKGEKLKTLLTKIEKLKKTMADSKKSGISYGSTGLEKGKHVTDSATETKKQKEKEQDLANERLKRRELENEIEHLKKKSVKENY